MKKLVYVTIALVALFAANSCKNKNNVPTENKPSFSVSIHKFAPLDSVKVEGISEKDMDMLVYHISLDKYTSNKQIREWLEVDKDTAAKVISALRKAGYIGDEYSNYMIPVNITTEVYFRLRLYNNSKK